MQDVRVLGSAGNHSQQAENAINFLRGCQLAKVMGNMEYTGTNLLQVIAMIADHVEKRLMFGPRIQLTALGYI